MENLFSNENLFIALIVILFMGGCLMVGVAPTPPMMLALGVGGMIGGSVIKYVMQKKTPPPTNQTTPPQAAKKQPVNQTPSIKQN